MNDCNHDLDREQSLVNQSYGFSDEYETKYKTVYVQPPITTPKSTRIDFNKSKSTSKSNNGPPMAGIASVGILI